MRGGYTRKARVRTASQVRFRIARFDPMRRISFCSAVFIRFGFLPLEPLFLFFQMPPAFFFRGHRGYGEKEHRIEDGQYEGQRKKRSEDVAGDIAFGVRPQKEADDSEHSQQHAVPERRRGEKEPCRGRRLPGGGSLHTRLAVGRGASGKCLSVTFVNLTMTRSRNMTMKNVGMSFAGCPPVTL